MDAIETRTMAKVSRRLIPYRHHLLFRCLSRSGEPELRRARDEQGPEILRHGLRHRGRGRGIFHQLLLAGNPIQSDSAENGCAPLDRAHHVHLGNPVRGHGLRVERMELLHHPLPVRRGRGGFFPGILYYLTLYFPAAYRGRMVSMYLVAIPVSAVIGAPLSTSKRSRKTPRGLSIKRPRHRLSQPPPGSTRQRRRARPE